VGTSWYCYFVLCFKILAKFKLARNLWIIYLIETWICPFSFCIHNVQGSTISRFHGDGTLFFSNGSKYVGKWEKGIAVEVRKIFRSPMRCWGNLKELYKGTLCHKVQFHIAYEDILDPLLLGTTHLKCNLCC